MFIQDFIASSIHLVSILYWISFLFRSIILCLHRGASPSIGRNGSLAPSQQLRDVFIEPVSVQLIIGHSLGSRDPASAGSITRPAGALESLVHLPLGAGVEEGESVACLEGTVVRDAHFHATHVEVQRRCAGVIAEDQVGIKLDVAVWTRLHAGVGLLAGCSRGDLGEEGTRGEVDERSGPTSKGFGASVDAQAIGMGRSWKSGRGDGIGGWGHCER